MNVAPPTGQNVADFTRVDTCRVHRRLRENRVCVRNACFWNDIKLSLQKIELVYDLLVPASIWCITNTAFWRLNTLLLLLIDSLCPFF